MTLHIVDYAVHANYLVYCWLVSVVLIMHCVPIMQIMQIVLIRKGGADYTRYCWLYRMSQLCSLLQISAHIVTKLGDKYTEGQHDDMKNYSLWLFIFEGNGGNSWMN